MRPCSRSPGARSCSRPGNGKQYDLIEVDVLRLGKLDLTSAGGKTILCVLAGIERDLLVDRAQSGWAKAKAEGNVLDPLTKTTARDWAKRAELHATGLSNLAVWCMILNFCTPWAATWPIPPRG